MLTAEEYERLWRVVLHEQWGWLFLALASGRPLEPSDELITAHEFIRRWLGNRALPVG